jgi:uncharacterized repeat protein (TIGR01451 family)
MTKKLLYIGFNWLVLLSLVLGLLPPERVMAAPAAAPVPSALVNTSGKSAAQCGVPEKVSFGQDLEAMIVGPSTTVQKLTQSYQWYNGSGIPTVAVSTSTNITPALANGTVAVGAALGLSKAVAVWRQAGTDSPSYANHFFYLKYAEFQGWLSNRGTSADALDYVADLGVPSIAPVGNPVVVAPNPNEFYVFTRVSTGGIYFVKVSSVSGISAWTNLKGTYAAQAVDPVAVALGPTHIALFFKATVAGTAQLVMSEANHDNWRSQPLALGNPSGLTIENITAVAGGTNRLSVLVAGTHASAGKQVYTKQWTTDNDPQWSDISWALVKSGLANVNIAAGSRTSTQLYLATYSGTSVSIKEWFATSGWKADVALTTAPGTVSGLNVIGLFSTEVMLVANTSAGVYTLKWTKTGGWETSWTSVVPVMAFVQGFARINHAAMFILTDKLTGGRWSSALQELTSAPATSAANLSSSPNPDGQLIVNMDGKPYWFNTYLTAGIWNVEVRNPANNWAGPAVLALTHPASPEGRAVSVAAADMDLDGRDEVVVATYGMGSIGVSQVDVSVIRLTPNASTGVAISASKMATPISDGSMITGVSVAIGDLDDPNWPYPADSERAGQLFRPDGKRAEVFISYYGRKSTGWNVRYYQYSNNTLSEQILAGSAVTLLAPTNLYRVEILKSAVARLTPGSGDYLIFMVAANIPLPSLAGVEIWAYRLDTDPNSYTRSLYAVQSSAGWGYNFTHGASFDLAIGDVNADTLDEILLATNNSLYSIHANTLGTPLLDPTVVHGNLPVTGAYQLAVGDIDQDGRQEVVALSGTAGYIMKESGTKLYRASRFTTMKVGGKPLVADLDGDSHIGTFADCASQTDYTVQTVLYAPPLYYNDNGVPVQNYSGRFAKANASDTSTSSGFEVSLGASLGVGVFYEQAVPILGITIGGFQTMLTASLMGSVGKSTEQTQSFEVEAGYGFEGGPSAGTDDRGTVVYTAITSTCTYYNITDPKDTANTYSMVVCTPTKIKAPTNASVDKWYTDIKADAGLSWVPLASNGVPSTAKPMNDKRGAKYSASGLPAKVDPYQVIFTGNAINVKEDSTGQNRDWSTRDTSTVAKTLSGSLEASLTLSTEVKFSGVVTETSYTAAYQHDWAKTQSWSESVQYTGLISDYDADPPDNRKEESCIGCTPYDVVPYGYTTIATAQDGRSYSYVVVDYYVTSAVADEAGAETTQAPQAAPQAPVVTSTTHPNPDTWYTNNTATLAWSQPGGDTAPLKGYRWLVDTQPDSTLKYVSTRSETEFTFKDLPEGLLYLHIQAVGTDSSLSPITHRAIRIDTQAPTAVITLDPVRPNGQNGWYTTVPVTATLSATDKATSVAALEYSTDGTTWNLYTTPLPFSAETAGLSLQARARDATGNGSTPVTTLIKIDKTNASTVDADGNRLTYASIQIQPDGNAQLVLGGALNDALAGRNTALIKAGDNGQWKGVDQVGVFPIPAGNQFTPVNQTELNWLYRPSFDARGVYPLYIKGRDMAGNTGAERLIGTFWWEPDARPDFAESKVSVTPAKARPGSKVDFTIAARNSGFQESVVKVTDTLPVGLTVDPTSITAGGLYDAVNRKIVWTLSALWPGEVRYLRFSATLADGLAPAQLQNNVAFEGYWEWQAGEGIPAEPAHENFATSVALDVLAGSGQSEAPRVTRLSIEQGQLVSSPDVNLLFDATLNARNLYVKEWVWDSVTKQWGLVQESGWLPFATTSNLTLTQDTARIYGKYPWMLNGQSGIHYVGVWVADARGNSSNLTEGNLIYTNLVLPAPQGLTSGQTIQYRLPFNQDEMVIFNLILTSGDANLYVWTPRHGLHPNYSGTAQDMGNGIVVKTVAFYAPESGVYVVEVQGVTDGSFQLVTTASSATTDLSPTTREILKLSGATSQEAAQELLARQAPGEAITTSAELPANPITLSSPLLLSNVLDLPALVIDPTVKIFLPKISTQP